MPGLLRLQPTPTDLKNTLFRIGVAAPEVAILFDTLESTPLWIKNTTGVYEWVNTAFIQNFGFAQRDEVLGKTDFELCDHLLAEQYREDDLKVLSGVTIHSRVELVGRFDHSARWCSTTKIPLHDAAGTVVGTAGITTPIRNARLPEAELLAPAIRLILEGVRCGTLTNASLAASCNLSKRAFERHFQARYHCSPQHYVRLLRVRLSCRQLVFSNDPIAAIAAENGFTDQSHFTREFRHFFGETPGAYRKRHQT